MAMKRFLCVFCLGFWSCGLPLSHQSASLQTGSDAGVEAKEAKIQPNFVIHPFYKAQLDTIATLQKPDTLGAAPQDKLVQTRYVASDRSGSKSNSAYYESIFAANRAYIADGFDFPLGPPNGNGYFVAQRFGKRGHLGEDWNGRGGASTDFGDPVYSIANGLVVEARDYGRELRWGKVVRVIYKLPEGKGYNFVEAIYAHLNDMLVQPGDLLRRGEQIGTIGDVEGLYSPHLHFELRYLIDTPLGTGYDLKGSYGHLDPSEFIKTSRPPL